jgi:hypothetical protein
MPPQDDDALRAERLLTFASDELEGMISYHNHKETMAWTGTAAYFAIVLLADRAAAFASGTLDRAILTAICIVLFFLAYLFVDMQFDARWVAADHSAALRRIIAKLLREGKAPSESLVLPEKPSADSAATVWPAYFTADLQACTSNRRDALNEGVTLLIKNPASFFRDARRRVRSEIASYLTMAVATLIAILRVWR